MKLRNVLIPLFALLAVASMAQDRALTVREAGVTWDKSEIFPNHRDGGCIMAAYGQNDAGLQEHARLYEFGGNKCDVVRSDSFKARKRDLQVGSGQVP